MDPFHSSSIRCSYFLDVALVMKTQRPVVWCRPKTQRVVTERTVQDVFDEMTEEQKSVVYFLVGAALEDERR